MACYLLSQSEPKLRIRNYDSSLKKRETSFTAAAELRIDASEDDVIDIPSLVMVPGPGEASSPSMVLL